MAERMNLTGVIDHMDDLAEGGKLTLGEVVDALGSRGYGPLLLGIALIELLPTGAIPGVPTILAVFIILVAGQLAVGRQSPWVPDRLRNKGFSEHKFTQARQKIRPYTQKLDKGIKPRLQQLTTMTAARVIAVLCILLALTMPPLELVPFASSIPSSAVGLFGIGLAAQDGLIILVGLVIAVAAFGGAFYWLVL